VTETASQKPKETTWDFIRTFLWAVLIAMMFRTFLFEPFHIPSGSMLPTLYLGDYIFVSKYSYGYGRYSFPFGSSSVFDGMTGRILASEPERGDIIVFRKPTDPKMDYIKRLVGLPGDRVQVINGLLYVNGVQASQRHVEDFQQPLADGSLKFVPRFTETLPGGVEHSVLDENPNGAVDNTEEYVVPEGSYFFMGDNRDNSQDSRYLADVGYVPRANLVGRAEIIMVSADPDVPFVRLIAWVNHLRYERFFTLLH
jgi:signal peptidase I